MGQAEIRDLLPYDGEGALSAVDIAASLGENVGTVRVLMTRMRNKRDGGVVTHEKIIDGASIYFYSKQKPISQLATPP